MAALSIEREECDEIFECVQQHLDTPLSECAACKNPKREDCWMYRMATKP